jgi:hypothetical protein
MHRFFIVQFPLFYAQLIFQTIARNTVRVSAERINVQGFILGKHAGHNTAKSASAKTFDVVTLVMFGIGVFTGGKIFSTFNVTNSKHRYNLRDKRQETETETESQNKRLTTIGSMIVDMFAVQSERLTRATIPNHHFGTSATANTAPPQHTAE